jgi:hypothetical protein
MPEDEALRGEEEVAPAEQVAVSRAAANASYEERLARSWESRHPAIGVPRFEHTDSRNRCAVCRACGYSATPRAFFDRHAPLFCQMHRAASRVGGDPNDLSLFKSTNLSHGWRDQLALEPEVACLWPFVLPDPGWLAGHRGEQRA